MRDAFWTFLDYREYFQQGVLIAVTLFALRKGAGPERATALALLYLLVADYAYHAIFGPGMKLRTMDVGHAVIDATACFAMVAIGTTANRVYTLWIGAFQIIAVMGHLARWLESEITPLAYLFMYVVPSYFQIALLATGTGLHLRRQRRLGKYRSWQRSLHRSPAIAPTGRPGD
ncbi:MAG: hypothetical protein ABIT16_04215 [Croceibacterium sp.]